MLTRQREHFKSEILVYFVSLQLINMFEIFNNIEELKKMRCITILSLYSLDTRYASKSTTAHIS